MKKAKFHVSTYNTKETVTMNKVPWILEHPFFKPTTTLGILCAECFLTGIIFAKIFC